MTRERPRAATIFWQAALIILMGGWIYGPALHGGWVWDDLTEIPQNSLLPDPHGLAKIWAGASGPDYFPLKTSVQWILWRAWGEHPTGYHLVSLGLHLLSALLFWRLLQKLGLRFAWLGGLFFVVHPLVVESVAWIAELKNTLSLAFLLAAMLAYLRFDQGVPGERRRPYALALIRYALALLSKSSVVMFPFVLLLYAWWRRGRVGRRDLAAAAPFFGLSLLLGLLTVFFQYHRALAVWTIPVGGPASHLAVAGTSLAFYLGKSLVPLGLHPMYWQWSVLPPTPVQFLPWAVLAILLAWLGTRRAPWSRAVLFGLGFFLLNLLPVLGFLPMSYLHISWVADHFAYLPLLGLIGLGVGAVGVLWQRFPTVRTGLVGGIAAVALLMARESRGYAGSFESDEALWTRTLLRNPQAWMAHIDLGRDQFQAGRLQPAISEYDLALGIRPDLPEAYYNRGSTYLRMGRLPEAERDLEMAIHLQPDSPDAQTNLGNALARSGDLLAAIPHYEEALRLQPDAADARANLAQAHFGLANDLAGRREFSGAIGEYRRALEAQPDSARIHANLGNALLLSGRLTEAVVQYQEALRLDPADEGTRANLSLARRAQRNAAP
jgi:protein O-mannosyl-transferase